MYTQSILSANFVTLALSVGLGVLIVTNRSFDKKTTNLFLAFVFAVLLLDISDMADFYLKSFDSLVWWRYVSSASGYAIRPLTLAIIIQIFLRRKVVNVSMLIPAFINALLAATSWLTHWMYWFTEQNKFCRGPLGYLPHILSGAYMLGLVILSIRRFRTIDKGELFTVYYIAVICVFATVLESTTSYKFLLPGAMMISCALYFTYLYIQTYKRDALTGVLNRHSFYLDAEKIKTPETAIISADLNGLKDINDTRGHAAGDAALRTLADALVSAAGRDYRIYRTGGDEFMALGFGKNEDEAQHFINAAHKNLESSDCMAAFGHAIFSRNEAFEDACNAADARMYEDKQRYKHRTAPRQ